APKQLSRAPDPEYPKPYCGKCKERLTVKWEAAFRWDANSPEDLEALLEEARRAVEPLQSETSWRFEVTADGWRGGAHVGPWESLLALISQVNDAAVQGRESHFRHRPTLAEDEPLADQIRVFGEIRTHLESGQRLGWLILLQRRDWRRLLEKSRVADAPP